MAEYPQGMSIHTVDDLKRAYRACGSYFFEPDTMRFFRSRLAPGIRVLPSGAVGFITSEQFQGSQGYRAPRLYTMRIATFASMTRSDGRACWDVDTREPFGFQHAASLREARRLLSTYVEPVAQE